MKHQQQQRKNFGLLIDDFGKGPIPLVHKVASLTSPQVLSIISYHSMAPIQQETQQESRSMNFLVDPKGTSSQLSCLSLCKYTYVYSDHCIIPKRVFNSHPLLTQKQTFKKCVFFFRPALNISASVLPLISLLKHSEFTRP